MKKGTKLLRIKNPIGASKMIVGKTYECIGSDEQGWMKLKELKSYGYGWDVKNFIVVSK